MIDILVVDDEPELREVIREILTPAGFAVRTAGSGAEARAAVAAQAPDLLILDVGMPGEDGFSVARDLRAAGAFGIVMLTAFGDTVDRIVGLEVGADDYVVKPFEPTELLARIRAVLRRRRPNGEAGLPPGAVRVGRFVFRPGERRLVGGDGGEVRLTALEAELLTGFAVHAGKVLSRDELLSLVPARGDDAFDRSIDNRIKRLRRKIEVDPARPEVIKTVRGAGYVLSAGQGKLDA